MTIGSGSTASASEVIESVGRLASQNTNRILKSDTSVFVNEQYSGADDFTDSNGVMNTVDTTNSTCIYDSTNDLYSLSGTYVVTGTTSEDSAWTDEANAFDLNDATYASRTFGNSGTLNTNLGKTFVSKYVGWIKAKADFNLSTPNDDHQLSGSIYVETYDGSDWNILRTVSGSDASGRSLSKSIDESVLVDESVEGIRIRFSTFIGAGTGDEDHYHKIYNCSYIDTFNSTDTVETDSIISDVVPDSIVVYGEKDLPTDTSITVDVSDDGGSTFSITGKELDTAIDTTSFSGSDLALKFNLATTDTAATPKLYGYGVAITDA